MDVCLCASVPFTVAGLKKKKSTVLSFNKLQESFLTPMWLRAKHYAPIQTTWPVYTTTHQPCCILTKKFHCLKIILKKALQYCLQVEETSWFPMCHTLTWYTAVCTGKLQCIPSKSWKANCDLHRLRFTLFLLMTEHQSCGCQGCNMLPSFAF